FFFFSSRRRHTSFSRDWSSDVCSSDLRPGMDDKTRARLLRIQRAEQQCTDLISALLLLSRNERGHGASDVRRVAEQLLDAHRARSEERRVGKEGGGRGGAVGWNEQGIV